jgi:phage terminase small subunit
MEQSTPVLGIVDEAAAAENLLAGAKSDLPLPLRPLSRPAQLAWIYVTTALHDYGLIHRTDAMLIHVIVSTFVQWDNAEALLEKHMSENDGSFMTITPKGYQQPHQLFYAARDLKRELLQLLPEACLTIPSFAKVKQAMRDPQQPDLFDPLVAFVSNKPQPPKLVHSR